MQESSRAGKLGDAGGVDEATTLGQPSWHDRLEDLGPDQVQDARRREQRRKSLEILRQLCHQPIQPERPKDRDGGPPLLRASRARWAFVELCFADSGYAGDRVANASRIRVEIVRKSKGQVGFTVHARRWVVERFFAWINRNRRLAKDFEASIASAEAFLYAASVMLLLRRSARCR